MAIDSSIALNVKPVQIESPLNSLAQVLQMQQGMQNNQLGQLKLDEYARQKDRSNKLIQLMQQLPASSTDEDRMNALKGSGYFDEADKLQAGQLARQKTSSEAEAKNIETAHKKIDLFGQTMAFVKQNPTPENANAALDHLAQFGIVNADQVKQYKTQIAANPASVAQLAEMGYRSALNAKDQLPQLTSTNLGGSTQMASRDPLTGKVTVNSMLKNTQSPDSIASVAASLANNKANIAKDLTIAGINSDGSPSATVESMAQQIAAGKLAPINGFALARPQGQAIMARVAQINPNYDATTYGAKVKASKDFTSGTQGNAMRSFAVAGDHLDQLGSLVDALNNGDMQLVNKIGNAFSSQTGSPAPTNFDAAKDVVSKEVIKAIVGGGGGVAERQELANLMDRAKSPAQLKGVISQYRSLMAAQHDALLQQRRAAGLPDSTMPKYNEKQAPSDTNDIHSQADAILKGLK